MHTHKATVIWTRGEETFTDNRYSRAHEWRFDGGVSVPASSSPLVVRPPLSTEAAVDPEEALVAAASSCHMLWFLSLAARQGFTVDRYADEALGEVRKNERGKDMITRIVLRPDIAYSGKVPTAEQLERLHHLAHEECLIANSLKAEIVIERS